MIRPYRLAEQRWDSPIAADLARRSVAQWLDEVQADEELRATATGLRGFFLADPEELSLIALVDQFAAEDGPPAPGTCTASTAATIVSRPALAAPLGDRLQLNTELVAVSHRGRDVRATLKDGRSVSPDHVRLPRARAAGDAAAPHADHAGPAGAAARRDRAGCRYGRATKTLLQFSRRFWRDARTAAGVRIAAARSARSGTATRNSADAPGILALLAGGGASDASQAILAREGRAGLAARSTGSGRSARRCSRRGRSSGRHDPLARGGYAYFDPGFDPALRAWLARPVGRLFFAGEHTSIKWQGYMNGAVESGRRAAAEIDATHRQDDSRSGSRA